MDWMNVLRVIGIYVLVAVVSGAIAYVGNDMGRRIGRKKLTILGLRPRHTSNVITMVTGSFIAVVTLTLFVLFTAEGRVIIDGISKTRGELNRLKEEVTLWRQLLEQSRIVYGIGQPLVQGAMEPGLSLPVQRERIMFGLDRANRVAYEANEKIARQMGEPPPDQNKPFVTWNEEEVDRVARRVMTAEKVQGIRIIAARNALYKEQVPVHLELLPVKLVFKKGEIVASGALDPDSPELLRQWYDFLDKLRQSALSHGMYELNDSLAGLTPEDFDRLIKEIKRLHGPGKLVAVARFDLYQTSSLQIDVQVHPRTAGQRGATTPLALR